MFGWWRLSNHWISFGDLWVDVEDSVDGGGDCESNRLRFQGGAVGGRKRRVVPESLKVVGELDADVSVLSGRYNTIRQN